MSLSKILVVAGDPPAIQLPSDSMEKRSDIFETAPASSDAHDIPNPVVK